MIVLPFLAVTAVFVVGSVYLGNFSRHVVFNDCAPYFLSNKMLSYIIEGK